LVQLRISSASTAASCEVSQTSTTMPVSASKAARQAKRAEGDKKKTAASKLASKQSSKNASTNGSEASSLNGDETPPMLDEDELDQPATTNEKMTKVQKLTEQLDRHGLSDRVTTGVLSSLATSRDVKITSVSLVFHGKVLITDTTLELNFGRRYGLLGENGCGKSTLLKAIDKREYPVPEHVDIYLLNEGAAPSDLGALEWVVKEAENEMERLDKLAETILENEGPESPVLLDLYEVRLLQNPSHPPLLTCVAHGKYGSIHFPDSSFPHLDRSWLQQKDHQ
jgi:ATP-binding cassette, subfamily F, member 2